MLKFHVLRFSVYSFHQPINRRLSRNRSLKILFILLCLDRPSDHFPFGIQFFASQIFWSCYRRLCTAYAFAFHLCNYVTEHIYELRIGRSFPQTYGKNCFRAISPPYEFIVIIFTQVLHLFPQQCPQLYLSLVQNVLLMLVRVESEQIVFSFFFILNNDVDSYRLRSKTRSAGDNALNGIFETTGELI